MISRCPSCGAPAPDEVRQCRACGWDFVTNKKGELKPDGPKKADPPKKTEPSAEKPKPAAPPSGGLALPPARGGTADVPATGLGMARLPKADPAGAAAPGAPDENPFALPVARNLGPKPGESLFSPPPVVVEPKLPAAKPKAAPEPEEEEEAPPAKAPVEKAAKKEPPARVPAAPAVPPKAKTKEPPPEEEPEAPAEEEEDDSSAALFLPSSTKEIVVEPTAKRGKSEEPVPSSKERRSEPVAASKESVPAGAAKPGAGKPSAVYLAAMAGGALGLFSVGAIFMMLRTEPPVAARPSGSSPFGKRSSGEASLTPVLDEPAGSTTPDAPSHSTILPIPSASTDSAAPTSIPAPAMSRQIEPPRPGSSVPAPAPAPVVPIAAAPAQTPVQAPVPVVPKPAVPEPATAPKVDESRPTATFARVARPKPAPEPAAPPVAAKAKPAAVKKPLGPQWVFEGTVYDLLTTRGVYGVRLVFTDAEDNEVASVEAGEGGHYHVSMKAGPADGYALRIVHDDYSGKHIDELDSTSSVRKADLEQRKFLMQAGARSLPWIGTVGKPVRRDMALVPKVAPE